MAANRIKKPAQDGDVQLLEQLLSVDKTGLNEKDFVSLSLFLSFLSLSFSLFLSLPLLPLSFSFSLFLSYLSLIY